MLASSEIKRLFSGIMERSETLKIIPISDRKQKLLDQMEKRYSTEYQIYSCNPKLFSKSLYKKDNVLNKSDDFKDALLTIQRIRAKKLRKNKQRKK